MLNRIIATNFNIVTRMSKKCKIEVLKQCSNSIGFENSSVNNICGNSNKMDSENYIQINKITRYNSPIKSESDKKIYSVIKLENGLTALLCSDVEGEEDISVKEEVDTSSSSDNEISEPESISSISSDISTKKLNKKSGKKEEKLGACSLTIGVGSFSDPPEIPGLAHFLEHMVFMGSTKYPQENEFDSFIKQKGGGDNASTDSEATTFYFECPEKHLPKAMDIFSQFFISPLMKRNAMTREREAIESEFTMSLPNDAYRKQQLICSTANDNNPGQKFSWGNLITLRDNVTDDFLYKSVHEFRERHYSAHRMTLAVQARIPLETLEEWVIKYFSNIPSNYLPPLEHTLTEPFRYDLFHKFYYVESVSDIMQIDLNWVMPETIKKYKTKPANYLSWLIGHEGHGSLISYLRKKLWATEFVAGQSDDGTVNNSLYSIFTISIVLTETGFENIQSVLDATFSFLNKIKMHGPDMRIFNEIKQIAELNFKFQEEQSAVDNVEILSESMQIYPSEYYIVGDELYFEFQPDEIVNFVNYLNPSSVNIMLSTKNHGPEIILDKAEEWFGTRYAVKDISTNWITNWDKLEPYQEFSIPQPNPYIASDFKILTNNLEAPNYPVKINNSNWFEIWHKPDTKFKHPVGFVGFHIVTSAVENSVVNSTMLHLYILLLNQYLIEELYPASMALLEYLIAPSEHGLLIEVYGFNEKLHLVLDKIAENIFHFNKKLNYEVFLTFQKICYRLYYNKNLKRSSLCTDIRMSILMNKFYTSAEKYNSIASINLDLLREFSLNLFNGVYVQGLVQGNILENTASDLCEKFIEKLKANGLNETEKPAYLVNELPHGEKCCQVKSFNVTDSNNYVINYYQFGPATVRDYCILDTLLMIMEEPLFDQLRTQQQLGYSVSCALRETYGILGFSVTVVSPIEKYKADYIESRITEFLNNFRLTLDTYPEKNFRESIQSLIRLKQCCDVHIKNEIKRNWSEIKCFEYAFDRLERQVTFLETLNARELKVLLEKIINKEMPTFKKLSIQVVGHIPIGNKPETGQRAEEPHELPETLEYQFLVQTSEKPQEHYIMNIKHFTSTLTTYPKSHIF